MKYLKLFENINTNEIVQKILNYVKDISIIEKNDIDTHEIYIRLENGQFEEISDDIDDNCLNLLYLAGASIVDENDTDHWFGKGCEIISEQIVLSFQPAIEKAAKKELLEIIKDNPRIYLDNQKIFDEVLDVPDYIKRAGKTGLLDTKITENKFAPDQRLINIIIKTITEDIVDMGDVSALDELIGLLIKIPEARKYLKGYLSEDDLEKYNKRR